MGKREQTENLHAGHRERVKDRFLSEGLDAFTDHQILEMLLFYAMPMKDTNELAHKMIKEFGSLPALFEASPFEIMNRCKVTKNTAIFLTIMPSLARRYFKSKWAKKIAVSSSSVAGEYAVSLFAGKTRESFCLISLDSQNRIVYADMMREGNLNESPVYPRDIVESAIRHKAISVILSHNHPSGSLAPSNADIETTRKLTQAMEAISIKVVDHIIVAGDKYVSFAEKGLL